MKTHFQLIKRRSNYYYIGESYSEGDTNYLISNEPVFISGNSKIQILDILQRMLYDIETYGVVNEENAVNGIEEYLEYTYDDDYNEDEDRLLDLVEIFERIDNE